MFAKLKEIISILREPMCGHAVEITEGDLQATEIKQWIADNPKAAPYIKIGDFFLSPCKQDCMTIVPREEFLKKFTFDIPAMPGVLTHCVGKPGFFT